MSTAKSDKLKLLITDLTLSDCYKEYAHVFSKDLVNQLSENKSHNHAINLKLDKMTLYKSLYNLSKIKLAML